MFGSGIMHHVPTLDRQSTTMVKFPSRNHNHPYATVNALLPPSDTGHRLMPTSTRQRRRRNIITIYRDDGKALAWPDVTVTQTKEGLSRGVEVKLGSQGR